MAAVLDSNNEALSREVLSQTSDSLRMVCDALDKHAVAVAPETVDLVGALSVRGPRTSDQSRMTGGAAPLVQGRGGDSPPGVQVSASRRLSFTNARPAITASFSASWASRCGSAKSFIRVWKRRSIMPPRSCAGRWRFL